MLPSVSIEWLCARYKPRIQACLVWIYVGLHLYYYSMDLCQSTSAARGLYTKVDLISVGYSLGYQHLIADTGLLEATLVVGLQSSHTLVAEENAEEREREERSVLFRSKEGTGTMFLDCTAMESGGSGRQAAAVTSLLSLFRPRPRLALMSGPPWDLPPFLLKYMPSMYVL